MKTGENTLLGFLFWNAMCGAIFAEVRYNIFMINSEKYKDLLIVSCDGTILYNDFSNLSFMKLRDEELNGRMLKDVFINIGNDDPVLLAAKDGTANRNYTVQIETFTGKKFTKTGCVYPIYREGRPFAAIEFSDIRYHRNDISAIETSSDTPRYRHNGTVYTVDDIITDDPVMIRLKKEIEKIALTDFPVLIYGKTGTGKELAAHAIHNSSRRFSKPFLSVNCGTIPENLAESMLFGTTKGSFTDSRDKEGFFEMADGGTLFLDEINSLPAQIQVKLLRAVERNVIRRIGDTKEKKVNVRVISATNEKPDQLIRSGRMIEDFYHRLTTAVFYLPGLNERGNDVLILADYFIQYFNRMMNMHIRPLGKELRDLFQRYDWPGNIRELRNVIEGAFAFTEGDEITIDDIPRYILERLNTDSGERFEMETQSLSDLSLHPRLERVEKSIIEEAFRESGSSLSMAAQRLGISKQLLKYKTDKYGIRRRAK